MAYEAIRRPVVVVDKKTGEVTKRFASVGEAARALGISEQGISQLAGSRSLYFGRHMVRYEADWHGWEDITGKRRRPVIVTRPDGGEQWFPSAPEAARALLIDKSAVYHALTKSPAEILGMPVRWQSEIGRRKRGV